MTEIQQAVKALLFPYFLEINLQHFRSPTTCHTQYDTMDIMETEDVQEQRAKKNIWIL
jgi:hypothetical protein